MERTLHKGAEKLWRSPEDSCGGTVTVALGHSLPHERRDLGRRAPTLKEQTAGGCVLITRPVLPGKASGQRTHVFATVPPALFPPTRPPTSGVHPAGPWRARLPKGTLGRGTEEDKLFTCCYQSGGHSSLISSAGAH